MSVLETVTVPPATTSLSLHDALPISPVRAAIGRCGLHEAVPLPAGALGVLGGSGADAGDPHEEDREEVHTVRVQAHQDRKSTRLNSSHVAISYAVFCMKNNNSLECAV